MSTTEIISTVSNLSLMLSVIVALIFGIAQVRVATRDRKERLTLETLRNYQSFEFSEVMFRINSSKVPASAEEWRKLPEKDLILFMQFSQSMEALGLLVAERYVDISLVDKTLGSFVTTSWEKFKPLMVSLRTEVDDPYLNEYFQWLAERLDERMKKYTRKPYHEINKGHHLRWR